MVDGFAKMAQIWVADAASGQCRQLTRDRSSKAAAGWSPDGRWMVFEQRRTATGNDTYRSALWVVDRAGKGKRKVSQGTGCDTCPRWSPDGTHIAFLHRPMARYPELDALAVLPLHGGRMRVLTAKLDRSIQDPRWSADGRRILCRVQEGPRLQVWAVTVRGAHTRQLTEGDRVIAAVTLSADTRRMVVVSSCPARPGELYLMGTGGRGYAVLAPNFRGSSGYGQAFLNANEDDFGGGDFADVMAGVDWLVSQGIADGRRLGMMGASYGDS